MVVHSLVETRPQIHLRRDDDDDDPFADVEPDDPVGDDDLPYDHIWVATRPRNRVSSEPNALLNIAREVFRQARLPLPYVDFEIGPARQRIFWYFEDLDSQLLERMAAAMRWLEDFSHWDIDEEDPDLFTLLRSQQSGVVRVAPLRRRQFLEPDGDENLPTFPTLPRI